MNVMAKIEHGLRRRLPDSIKNSTRQLRRGATQLRVHLRSLNDLERLIPSFLIIGAMKAGTTSLFRYLCDHPCIAPPVVKEIDYFNFNWSRPATWYTAHFPVATAAPAGTLTGEASTGYLVHPRAARRALERLPDARVIVLLRDPVTRTLSHYFHERRIGLESRPPDEALFADESRTAFTLSPNLEGQWFAALNGGSRRSAAAADLLQRCPMHLAYINLSRYADHLPAWLDAYGRERVLVLSSEEMFADSLGTLNKTLAFLGLDAMPRADLLIHNVGKYPESVDADIIARLRAEFVEPNERLFALLGRDFGWNDKAA